MFHKQRRKGSSMIRKMFVPLLAVMALLTGAAEAKDLPSSDNPITTLPMPQPPLREKGVLHLWIERNGQRERREIPCRLPCRSGEALLQASHLPQRPPCDKRPGGLRAGGYYLGQRIGVFRTSDSCSKTVWRAVRPIYQKYFR